MDQMETPIRTYLRICWRSGRRFDVVPNPTALCQTWGTESKPCLFLVCSCFFSLLYIFTMFFFYLYQQVFIFFKTFLEPCSFLFFSIIHFNHRYIFQLENSSMHCFFALHLFFMIIWFLITLRKTHTDCHVCISPHAHGSHAKWHYSERQLFANHLH